MPFSSSDPAAFLLALALRSTLILGAAFLVTLFLRRASAAIRHLVWVAAIIGVLAVPFLSSLPGLRVLPRWTSPEPVVQFMATLPPIAVPSHGDAAQSPTTIPAASTSNSPAPAARAATRPLSLMTVLGAIWIAGVLLAMVPPILGRILLARIQRRATPLADLPITRVLGQASSDLGVNRPVSLLLGEPNTMPMAWGLISPRILLPHEATTWPASHLRTVLLHELAHIKRHDCLTHLLAQIARAIYWPNPLAWVAVRALHTERERACDDLVLHAGAPCADYASQLLHLATGRRLSPASAAAMAMARPSQLEHRIRRILDTQRSRSSMTRTQLLIGAGMALAVVLPIAGLRSAMALEKQPEKKADRQWPPAPAEPALSMLKKGEKTNYTRSANNIRLILIGAAIYSAQNGGTMPPDLGALLPYIDFSDTDPDVPASKGLVFLSPTDQKIVTIPAEVTPDWVNQNSSYLYLGSSDLKFRDITDSGSTAVVYEKMDRGYLVMQPDNTVHEWFCVGYPDGRVTWPQSRESAESIVKESRKALEALRAGEAAPDDRQIVWELQHVTQAVLGYAKDHGGALPADLGSSLPYVATDSKQLSTPSKRAAIFVSPSARRGVNVPETPTADWINKNTTYNYLGGSGPSLDRIADPTHTVLLYDDLGRGDAVKTPRGEVLLVPFARVGGGVERMKRADVEEAIELSKKVLEVARNGGTLPDLPQAVNDTHILASAIRAYAKAHDDAMPPDLGATLPYLDTNSLVADTAAERAKVYLSPAAERKTALPAEVTPEWINQHGNYVYCGNAGLTLKQFWKETGGLLLVYSPLDEVLHMISVYGTDPKIAMGDVAGRSMTWPLEQFNEQFGEKVKGFAERRAAQSGR